MILVIGKVADCHIRSSLFGLIYSYASKLIDYKPTQTPPTASAQELCKQGELTVNKLRTPDSIVWLSNHYASGRQTQEQYHAHRDIARRHGHTLACVQVCLLYHGHLVWI